MTNASRLPNMPTAQPKRYYSVKEAAQLLSVSTNTIYTYLDTGKLKGRRIGRGRFKIPFKELQPFVDFELLESPQTEVSKVQVAIPNPDSAEVVEVPEVIAEVTHNILPAKQVVPQESPATISVIYTKPQQEKTTEETNILFGHHGVNEESEISPGKNDKYFWRLFKALSFLGLGLIYLASGNFHLNLGGGYLNETSQVLGFLLPIGLLTSGIFVLLDVFFEKKIAYYDTLIHICSMVVTGYYSFISIASGDYGIFVFAASFTVLLASHLVTGVAHRGTFFEAFIKFSLLAAALNGIVFILFPEYFPFPLISSLIANHEGVFGAFWFGLTVVPLLVLLSSYGKNSNYFAPIFIIVLSLFRLIFATQLTLYGMWDTAYISYLSGIFGLFLAWWKVSSLTLNPNRFASSATAFIWVAVAILVGLGAVFKSSSELQKRSRDIVVSGLEGSVQKIKSKIDSGKAVLVSNAGNPEILLAVKEGDQEKNINNAKNIYNTIDIAERVLILNAEGVAAGVYPRESLAQGTNFSGRDYFVKTKDSNKGFTSDVFTNILGGHSIVISEPLFEGNNFSGAVILSLDLQKLSLLVSDEVGRQNDVHVVDSQGVYAFGSNTNDIGRKAGELSYLKPEDDVGKDFSEKEIYITKSQNPEWEFNVLLEEKNLISESSYINLLLSIFVVVNSVFSIFAGIAISVRKTSEVKVSDAIKPAAGSIKLGTI